MIQKVDCTRPPRGEVLSVTIQECPIFYGIGEVVIP